MAYAASGLCVFAIVWAGFVLMAEGGEERGGGRAKAAVVMAVVGLVLVLSAKGVAALLSQRRHPILSNPIEKRKQSELKKLIERITRRGTETASGGRPALRRRRRKRGLLGQPAEH